MEVEADFEEIQKGLKKLMSCTRAAELKPDEPFESRIIEGDALEVLATLPDESIDLVVTDPPYGYSFMNKEWDRDVPPVEIWAEVRRVLKPGGLMFVMSSPRQDRLRKMIENIQEAGFGMDYTSIYWTYSSGFPKATSMSFTVDKKLGHKREKVGRRGATDRYYLGLEKGNRYDPRPLTEEGRRLDGSYAGFQPKPAVEIILVGMKPLAEKTYVDQALKNGKGVTWLDDCRIPDRDFKPRKIPGRDAENVIDLHEAKGRFPANLLVSDDILDVDQNYSRYFSLHAWWDERLSELPEEVRRSFPFLIVPKPSVKERRARVSAISEDTSGRIDPDDVPDSEEVINTHPTVKPLTLMAYLITLGSRPGDVVLDPFAGSGTTCIMAKILGRHYIGIEKDPEYARIAGERLALREQDTRDNTNESKPRKAKLLTYRSQNEDEE